MDLYKIRFLKKLIYCIVKLKTELGFILREIFRVCSSCHISTGHMWTVSCTKDTNGDRISATGKMSSLQYLIEHKSEETEMCRTVKETGLQHKI
jgi:hypothetical protein